MQKISNHELIARHIPATNADWLTISQFALTFDGYKSAGSFEKCAEIANTRRNTTLTELRTSLFFEQRRWRHFHEDPNKESMIYIRALIEMIRSKVEIGALE